VAAAVQALERAAIRTPGDARVLSDLAAAYYVRAHEQDEPRDLVRSLAAAFKARETDTSLPEARFNLALVLERLHLRRLALAEWRAYFSLDRDSSWTQEARAHLDALERPSRSEQWRRELPAFEAAALQGDGDRVQRIVEASPQLAREHVFETVLGSWGDAVAEGRTGATASRLRIASEIGKAILSVNGDAMGLQAVEAIEKVGMDSVRYRELARGHQALRDAMAAYRLLRTGEAAARFAVAREALERGGSPLHLWALCGLARYWAYEGRYDEAVRAYQTVLTGAEQRGFSSLTGWTQWGLLWVAGRQGRPMEVLSRARAMEQAYGRAREDENLGAARLMVGDGLFLLGQDQAGWRYLYQALKALAEFPTVFRRHALLQRAATAARAEGLPEAALVFQNESLRIAEETRDPIRLTETRRARAEILSTLDRPRAALAELDVARRTVGLAPQDATGRKLRADLLWAEAEVSVRLDPRRALESFSQAIEEYGQLKALSSVAYASFGRARAERALGLDDAAKVDLETALRIVEDPATNIREEDLRLSYAESIQDLYDEAILAAWKSGSAEDALAVLERSRAFPRGFVERTPEADPLPADGVIVEYALLSDRLLIWVIGRQGISSYERRIESGEVEALVRRFVAAIRRGSEEILPLASRLHDLLIPEPVSAMPQDRVVYVIPDKVLNKVPFAALRNRRSRRFFVEEHPVALAASLAQLRSRTQAPAAATLSGPLSALLVGNPTFDRGVFRTLRSLPGAEAEIGAAGGVFRDSLALLGREATPARVLAELDRFDVFVFAGHAVVNSSLPSRSYLVLAHQDGRSDPGILLAERIGGLRLRRLRLVVLSACSSAGPREARGAGLAGLARPFLAAGARTVVGTLWDVADQDTAGLLADFYRAVASGRPPIQALREAQLARLRRSDRVQRLRLWGAFEVVGTDQGQELLSSTSER
jgi:CHAT domain-containing protein